MKEINWLLLKTYKPSLTQWKIATRFCLPDMMPPVSRMQPDFQQQDFFNALQGFYDIHF